MDKVWIDAVGVGAALCSMTSFTPQIVKIWKERDASAVSLRMFALTVTGFGLWTAYGALSGSWPIVLSNAVCLALSAVILGLKLRFSGGGRQSPLNHAP
jgi:MtN3 and saliva related transmembrane protein